MRLINDEPTTDAKGILAQLTADKGTKAIANAARTLGLLDAINLVRTLRDASLDEVKRLEGGNDDYHRTLRCIEMGSADAFSVTLAALWKVEKGGAS